MVYRKNRKTGGTFRTQYPAIFGNPGSLRGDEKCGRCMLNPYSCKCPGGFVLQEKKPFNLAAYDSYTVESLNDRDDLMFVSDSQDVTAIKESLFGSVSNPEVVDFDSFFVKVGEGDYQEVYGMSGTVPYLGKFVTRLK
jgi:hypothetical protein